MRFPAEWDTNCSFIYPLQTFSDENTIELQATNQQPTGIWNNGWFWKYRIINANLQDMTAYMLDYSKNMNWHC